jgi:hypothetical protein
MKRLEKIMVFLLVAVAFFTAFALAEPYGADDVSYVTSSRYNTSAITPDSIDAIAGNVTEITLNATTVTTSWQGFYGNVSGEIILADSSGNNFYDWNLSTPSGQVYASRSDAVTWESIACITPVLLGAEETYLGQTADDGDSITNTYTLTNHPWFLSGTTNITGCNATKAYDSTGEQGADSFWQVLLSDGANTVYSTILEDGLTNGFNNAPWHFELLVGENGKSGSEGSTPYYFYVELQ